MFMINDDHYCTHIRAPIRANTRGQGPHRERRRSGRVGVRLCTLRVYGRIHGRIASSRENCEFTGELRVQGKRFARIIKMRQGVARGVGGNVFIEIWVDVITSTNETPSASLLPGRLYSVCLSVCVSQK